MFKQAPQMVMKQLENKLKMTNPQAFKEFQEARQNNVNPNDYLNKITGGFNQEQRQEWDSIMKNFSGMNSK